MKQLRYLLSVLFILTLFTSCSSDDDGIDEPIVQDHTSFVIDNKVDITYYNVVLGVQQEDENWKRVGDLGTVNAKSLSKEIILNDTIKKVYLFLENRNKDGVFVRTIRRNEAFVISNKTKNILVIEGDALATRVNPSKSKEYPIN